MTTKDSEFIKKPSRAKVKPINVFEDSAAPAKRTYRKKAKADGISDALVLSTSSVAYSDSTAMVLGENQAQDAMNADLKNIILWTKNKLNKLQSSFFKNKEIIIIASGLSLVALLSIFYIASPSKNTSVEAPVIATQASEAEPFNTKALMAANLALLQTPGKAKSEIIAKNEKALSLKAEKTLTMSVLFLDGATTLGPAGRAKALEIKNKMVSGDKVDLYGYAGINRSNDEKFQYTIAQSRAMSVKMQLVELGADPKMVSVMDPNGYLFSEPLPQDPKQVKSVIRSKND